MNYADLTLRNIGYIPPETQDRIRNTRVLIAGCGIGSNFAETVVRLGYEKLILIDHDTIAPHNLNRQNFTADDIGSHKVEALAKRLRAINPNVQVEVICDKVTTENALDVVAKADLVFDTIDFLSLSGLVALHDACHTLNKALVTAVAVGFGAAAFYFPEHKKCTIRDLFDLPRQGSVDGIAYAERYAAYVQKIAHRLDPVVVGHFFETVKLMSEGKPCPASQVAPGAACVAALAGTIAVRIAQGLSVLEAPEMIMIDLTRIVQHG